MKELYVNFKDFLLQSKEGKELIKDIENKNFQPKNFIEYSVEFIYNSIQPIETARDLIIPPPNKFKKGRQMKFHYPIITSKQFQEDAEKEKRAKSDKDKDKQKRLEERVNKKKEKEKNLEEKKTAKENRKRKSEVEKTKSKPPKIRKLFIKRKGENDWEVNKRKTQKILSSNITNPLLSDNSCPEIGAESKHDDISIIYILCKLL